MAQVSTKTRTGIGALVVAPGRQRRPHLSWWQIIIYLFLGIFFVSSLGPLVFTLISSFKTMHDVLAFPPSLLPNPAILSNYTDVLSNPYFLRDRKSVV